MEDLWEDTRDAITKTAEAKLDDLKKGIKRPKPRFEFKEFNIKDMLIKRKSCINCFKGICTEHVTAPEDTQLDLDRGESLI